ncbi:MAG: GNAT family N-acetyltransferase [Firmicutes bacterium]|nr:GNAT family N-acetyltransferase [Bacillota bacterium]
MFEIKKLTPDLIQIFTDYLENISFGHAPHWSTCYCHYYHNQLGNDEWFKRSGEQNKTATIQAINEGLMTGFLAFDNNQCIGWLNGNQTIYYPRLEHLLKPIVQDRKVAMTICFIVHPDFRNKGVARKLLSYAIEYYRDQGFDGMIATPVDMNQMKELNYHGTLGMYQEQEYELLEIIGNTHLMYKTFK